MPKDFNRFCQVTKQRMHAFVLHDWTPAHVVTLTKHGESAWCKGMGWNYEICPKTKRPHLQGWVNLTNVLNWPKFKAHIGIDTLHCELVESAAAITSYCVKEDTRDPDNPTPVLIGKEPMTQNDKGRSGEAYYEHNLDALEQGRPEDMDASAEYNLKNFEYAVHARKKRKADLSRLAPPACHHFEWHSGVGGSGKTEYCNRKYPDHFLWLPGNEWNGYNYQDVVVFSDIDHMSRPTMNQMKTWFDLGKFPVRILYSYMEIRPKIMVVNSNEPTFEDMFPKQKDVHVSAIKRRFKQYIWTQPYFLDEDAGILNPDWIDPTV